MNKKKFRYLRLAYKISLSSVVLLVAIIVLQLFFVLLPLYSLVGDIDEPVVDGDKKVESAQLMTNVALGAISTLAVVSIGSASYGAYQDVRNKSKK